MPHQNTTTTLLSNTMRYILLAIYLYGIEFLTQSRLQSKLNEQNRIAMHYATLSDSDLPILRQRRNQAPSTTRQFFLTSSCWNHLYIYTHCFHTMSVANISRVLVLLCKCGRSLNSAFADGSETRRILKIRVVCMCLTNSFLPLPPLCHSLLTYRTPAHP